MPKTNSSDSLTATLELDAKARLGEGALWHPTEQVLYWVDIEGKALHLYDPETKKDKAFDVGERIGTVVPVENGGALVALQNGIFHIDTRSGELRFLTNPIKADDIRFNDGKCDPAGRFWVGTMALDTRVGAADLYMLDLDGKVHHKLDKLTISNGIVWSLDKKTMYFTDTKTQEVKAYDYDNETGEISNGSVIINIPEEEGSPDGMTLDSDGNLWIALHGGGGVAKYNPKTGEQLQKVKVPTDNTTSCGFGGKNLDTLYITTAKEWQSEEKLKTYPKSGGLFSVKPGVRGVPANFYRGPVQGLSA
ncbi:SMP-30/gluconolactonase/LRE family protein [Pontibacter cellulosilyticus]|uniref:SMP-30/gluconolactonase/LRE family protein n=1 Tax=Pontibacter cellulosilyticus TaxID=1720253 RepID=A0A923N4G4_9BACT|nr:SMP-30/gluconolactonase/LRE family protein [Pontibacter cellulosilyticus]MBC5991291.1 SMP-30/gluconolactonase/LRE family protein [Pontibacter cellulosilyticus]